MPGPLRAIPRGYPRRLWAPPRRHCPAPLGVRSPILPYWLYFHTPLYRITSHSFIYKSCCSCCLRAPFELIKLARAGIYKLLRSSACWVPSAIHTTGESSSHLDGRSTASPPRSNSQSANDRLVHQAHTRDHSIMIYYGDAGIYSDDTLSSSTPGLQHLLLLQSPLSLCH